MQTFIGKDKHREKPMTVNSTIRNSFPGQVAVFALASALCVSAAAQQPANGTSNQAPAATQPSPGAQNKLSAPPQEGFWGKVNPFARKKWVARQTDPIKSQLNELDEVNAKNANDIKDVDARAQAGINKAQSTADQANQVATAAGTQAQQAGTIAGQASGKVDQLNGTVNGLDQYAQKNTVSIAFRRGTSVLSPDAKKQLDDIATALNGQKGYLLEVEAHAPGAGSVGIQNSDRLAEAVKRYLVTEHEIPVYRMHSVALGNVPPTETAAAGAVDDTAKPKPVRTSYVELRLMENSLAAQDGSTPRSNPSQTGAAQP
jgi:outer membrane protein OmpA-like peptidoglycan-associated protein